MVPFGVCGACNGSDSFSNGIWSKFVFSISRDEDEDDDDDYLERFFDDILGGEPRLRQFRQTKSINLIIIRLPEYFKWTEDDDDDEDDDLSPSTGLVQQPVAQTQQTAQVAASNVGEETAEYPGNLPNNI